MLDISLGLFAVAALFGLYMASRIFRGAMPPWPAAILHGLLAASGLTVLLYAVVTTSVGMPIIAAAVLLVIAALGGFFMLTFHMRTQTPPKFVVVVHALAAVSGVAIILGDALGML